MGLTLSQNESGKEFEKLPAGSYIGRCFGVVDIGTQTTNFNGEIKDKAQVILLFEVLDDEVRREDGEVFIISKTFSASLDPKATLRKTLDGWRGRPFTEAELKKFELGSVLGAYAQLGVIHSPSKDGTKTYVDLNSIAPLHKSIQKPQAVSSNLLFDLSSQDYLDYYAKLPKWIQKKVEESKEWKGATNHAPKRAEPAPQTAPGPEDFDDMPF